MTDPKDPSEGETAHFQLAGSFGDLAVDRGFATRAQVDECLDRQAQLIEQGENKRLGEIMLEMGYLLPHQLSAVVNDQEQHSPLQQISNYRLITKIGEGGMGTVYKARREPQGSIVALKVLFKSLADDAVFITRFRQEAEIGLKLDHPNLVKCLDTGDADGVHYMALEFIDGEDLGDGLQRRNRYPEGQSLAIILAAARAMAYAHGHGLIHRDVKPANIMLTRKGKVKVMDFGLARQVLHHDQRITMSGVLMGTPHYISPEQVDGKVEIDGRSDIYSLGLTLYHMLTGRPPFIGGNLYEILSRHASEPIPDPRTFNKELSPEAAALVMAMADRNPEDRLPTMDAVVLEVRKVMGFPAVEQEKTNVPLPFVQAVPIVAPGEQKADPATAPESTQQPHCPRCSASYEGDPLLLGKDHRIRCNACGLMYLSQVSPTDVALSRQSAKWTYHLELEENAGAAVESPPHEGPSPWRPKSVGPVHPSWIHIDGQTIIVIGLIAALGYFGYAAYRDHQAEKVKEQQAAEAKRMESEAARERVEEEERARESARRKALAEKRAAEEKARKDREEAEKRSAERLRLRRERAEEKIRMETERRMQEVLARRKAEDDARERKRLAEERRQAEEARKKVRWTVVLRNGNRIEAQNIVDAGHELSIKDALGKFHVIRKSDVLEKIERGE